MFWVLIILGLEKNENVRPRLLKTTITPAISSTILQKIQSSTIIKKGSRPAQGSLASARPTNYIANKFGFKKLIAVLLSL